MSQQPCHKLSATQRTLFQLRMETNHTVVTILIILLEVTLTASAVRLVFNFPPTNVPPEIPRLWSQLLQRTKYLE